MSSNTPPVTPGTAADSIPSDTHRPFVAVYAICKNEAQFVHRFMSTVIGEADAIFITDTGSTDNTMDILRAYEEHFGVHVQQRVVSPWRFDVARNLSLDFVPPAYEVVVCLDLDEVISPGWAKIVRDAWVDGVIFRGRYKYVWSHTEDGGDGVVYWADKIHSRNGYFWKGPVHEHLTLKDGLAQHEAYMGGFRIDHWPDDNKPRSSYLPLLELATKEEPGNDRYAHYYARELMYYGRYREAIAEFMRHLSLPKATWRSERARSMLYIGRCYAAARSPIVAEQWYRRCTEESPGEREGWVALMWLYYLNGDWERLVEVAARALEIKERPASYMTDPNAWGSDVPDLASIGWYRLGFVSKALALAKEALALKPTDPRLKDNVEQFERELKEEKPSEPSGSEG